MCGIAGIIGPGTNGPLVARMLDRIAHRGPDGEGLWSAPVGGERTIHLGHRRLAILDLTQAGAQPMLDQSGDLALTFNGEIYNYVEIRAELRALGVEFRSDSDSEVIIEAYRQWGADCLDRFNGMFAFAVYDRRRNILFCARDRFGEKPFLFARKRDFFAFASEYKALLQHPGLSLDYDQHRLIQAALSPGTGLDSDRQTLFNDVEQLLPGEELVYSGVAEPFYRARQAGHQDPSGTRTLLLVGGTYRRAILDQYLGAIADWLQTLSATDQARFRLRYAGADHDVVTDAAAAKGLLAVADITPAIPLDALADLVRTSFCATYLWSPHTFHHKLLELLVAGQAVVAFPGEHAESVEFAGQCDTPFAVARDRASLIEQLSLLWAAAPQSATRRAAPRWRWGDFADGLEAFFEAILSSKHSAGDKQRHEVER